MLEIEANETTTAMSIKLQNPYKIIEQKYKRYTNHYQIPANDCVIVPQKIYGENVSCDVHWKDEFGIVHKRSDMMFLEGNLVPLNAMKDYQLYEVWQNNHENVGTVL